MRLATCLLLTTISYASAQPSHVPACLAGCLRNVTNPCDGTTLGLLINCINQQCLAAASRINIMFTPKAEYSCQQSLVPGTEDSSSPMTVVGDSSCVSSPYDFKSFIASTRPETHMNSLGEGCEFDLFPNAGCMGEPERIDINSLKDGTCAFNSGRSARLSCREAIDPSFNPYRYLEQMCANNTSTTPNATMPTPYASSMAANSTVHSPSITTTISATPTSCASDSANRAKDATFLDSAAGESPMKPSLGALVAVVFAAIVMI